MKKTKDMSIKTINDFILLAKLDQISKEKERENEKRN